ncbi:MAG TPA: TylF/MycF/NovP-related O-methyltransferase [Longimicrobiaceae bacterium]|nr:TylF/MycF/NovP-related O-methyltransferase [Longimicrobiaceae bacterium]
MSADEAPQAPGAHGGGSLPAPSYDSPGLKVWWHTVDFADPRFADAYRFGMEGARDFLLRRGAGPDVRHEWPVLVGCWAAWHAAHLPGDFVECGTNTGLLSMAVCRYVDFNRLDKDFYLFDTYRGIPPEQISDAEKRLGRETLSRAVYRECYAETKRSFAGYPRVKLVRGRVPDTLRTVEIELVCYLSIDMNVALPERAALEHFWERLSPGAPVLLDDYGKARFIAQRRSADEFARARGVKVLDLPTGQGLLLKP